ncbi:MAG: hypothetical protein RMK45_06090 [Armatimonadota bacterium]|nr:hypothetical protein [Armatimonadota bacterium]
MSKQEQPFPEALGLLLVGGLMVALSGCGGASAPDATLQADLTLTATDNAFNANRLRQLYQKLSGMAEPMRNRDIHESPPLRVLVPTNASEEIFHFTLVRNAADDYPHLRVVRPKTGEHANFVFGGSLPQGITLRLTDDSGRTLQRDGRALEFPLSNPRSRAPQDWIATGIRIAALAFVVWLGAIIVRGVAAAVGFVAFNLIVLGILAATAGVVIPIIRWFLDTSGITWETVRQFIEQTVETIVALLREVADWLARAR